MHARPTALAVLREEPRFRLLLGSQVLSVLGERITQVVLPFAVLAVGGGIGGIAVVSAAQFLPYVVLALPAGVWSDRCDRARVLVAADAVRLLCQLTAAGLLLTGRADVPSLAAVAAVHGVADAFSAPALSGLLPTTVSSAHLQPANALRALGFSGGSIIGPVVGGVLVALGGPASAFAFDALAFATSMVLLLPLRGGNSHRSASRDVPARFRDEIGEGWHEVRSRSWVLGLLSAIVVYHLLALPSVLVLGPVVMVSDHHGAESWAQVMACFGIGGVVGNAVALRWRPRFPVRAAALLATGASFQPAALGSGLGTVGTGVLVAVTAASLTAAGTLWETALGTHVPGHVLSRVASYDHLASRGAIPLGSLLVGVLGVAAGPHPVLIGATVVSAAACLAVSRVPGVRSLPSGRTQASSSR